MSEMIERIAMAMAAELKRQTDEPDALGAAFFNMDGRLDDVIADGVFDLMALARAAIDAMREPNEEMLTWGEAAAVLSFNSSEPDSRNIRPIWRAMVDEALK